MKIAKNRVHILQNDSLFYLDDDEFEDHESDDMDCFSDLEDESPIHQKKSDYLLSKNSFLMTFFRC